MTGSRQYRRAAVLGLALSVAGAFACSDGPTVVGVYANADGLATLDLKAGDQASFTVMGDTQTCSYKRSDAKLTLTCPGQQVFEFSIAADGSLTSEGTFIGAMKKK